MLPSLALSSLLSLVSPALAAPAPTPAPGCDAKALGTALTDASPGPSAQAFVDLAACDTAAAKLAAPAAFKRILAGPTGDAAALVAISLGQGAPVRDWLDTLQADERASTLNHLGEACDKPGVATFWTDSATAKAEKFWSSRWYAALDSCHVASAQALLSAQITASKSDRAMFAAVLGTYATNAGAAALPTIEALAGAEKDPLVWIDLVRALPAAGGVGDPAGPNAERLAAAVAALGRLAPSLPERAFPEARKAYLALGDEQSADSLAAIRYKDMLVDGKLLYGIVAVESATCKKGDARVTVHAAPLWDSGHAWPDQLVDRAKPNAEALFEPKLAETCKGTGTVEWFVPDAPFANMQAYSGWVAAEKATIEHDHAGVAVKMDVEVTAVTD